MGACSHLKAHTQIKQRNFTRPWRLHKTTGGRPRALFFWPPMPEPEEGPSRTPLGGHLANCGLLNRNAAGGVAPQPVKWRSIKLAIGGPKKARRADGSRMKDSEPISALDGLHSANIRCMYHWPGPWEATHDSDHSDGSQTLLHLSHRNMQIC